MEEGDELMTLDTHRCFENLIGLGTIELTGKQQMDNHQQLMLQERTQSIQNLNQEKQNHGFQRPYRESQVRDPNAKRGQKE